MGGKAPAIEVPPVVTQPADTAQAEVQIDENTRLARERQIQQARARAAAQQTILTSSQGDTSTANIGKTKLGA